MKGRKGRLNLRFIIKFAKIELKRREIKEANTRFGVWCVVWCVYSIQYITGVGGLSYCIPSQTHKQTVKRELAR